MLPYELWITADACHIAQIASWYEEAEDAEACPIACFSPSAVQCLRDHAHETRPPAPIRMNGQEEIIRVVFDTEKSRVAFWITVLELGGEVIPQIVLPASASAALVP